MAERAPALPANPVPPRGLAARAGRIAVSATSALLMETARRRAAGETIFDFGIGEPDFDTPQAIQTAAIEAIRAGFTRYAPVPGLPALRSAIVAAHARDFGTAYAPDEAMACAGGKQALFNALAVLVEDGDEVIVPAPYWVSYRHQIRFTGATPVLVETRAKRGFELDAAAVEAHLTPRTRAVIVNSPHNPTGAVYGRAAWRALLEVCRSRGLWLITDECYARLVFDTPPYSVAAEPDAKDWVIVAGSLSKSYAMTGWRLGYALAPRPVIEAMISLQSHSSNGPTTFVQQAAVTALSGDQAAVTAMVAEYRERRDLIVSRLRAVPGVSCARPAGAFYAYPDVSRLLGRPGGPADAAALAQALLRERGVATVPAEAFGGAGHLRFSFACSTATISAGLERFAEHCAHLID